VKQGMIDWTKPVQTRDGRKVRVLCTDANNGEYPVIALVAHESRDTVVSYRTNGGSCIGRTSAVDAINVPEQVHRWINVCSDGHSLWTSRALADEYCTSKRIGVIELVVEGDRIVSCNFENTPREDCK